MKKANTNTIVAVAALVTSVVAVFIAWDEARLQRQNQAATFMPILETQPSFSLGTNDLRLGFTIRNSGHGTAFVQFAEFRYDGEPLRTYSDFARKVLTEELGRSADLSWYSMEGFLIAGESKPVLSFRWEDTEENREALSELLSTKLADRTEKTSLVLCYCSVFDECWQQASLGSAQPKRVRSCPEGDDPSEVYWQTRDIDGEAT
ncbi:hypothetical protein [Parvularcula lutaonensis]|uniref:Uncharacterized protein n=1 Tax=Parvularcula lutaonensis TaxID=491923 RepID=A0ABV7MA31_9PROT|nr:hypothetical protein [Parvularcula lutaonensis]GGY35989.1 hypothetical protein GCM10007148_00080 [Parvularcula lutaonensis]